MSDDTPTQKIATGELQEDLQEEKQKSKGLLIGLIIAGVLLLIAIIVLVFFLGRATGTPGDTAGPTTSDSPTPSATPSPTPSETPSATPTPTEEPPAANPPPSNPTPVVNSFTTGTSTVWCGTSDNPTTEIDLNISWSTSNGNRVYFGVDTNDASAAPFFDNLPLSGNSGSNFPSGYVPFQFVCGPETHKYTLTVVDGQGHKASKSVTVKDLSYALNN